MGTLSARARKALPSSDYGEPAQRKYPMPDASHAANAKSRAAAQHNRGKISDQVFAAINRKANSRLKGK